jgi:oligopeptide transport system substrate-binding protein
MWKKLGVNVEHLATEGKVHSANMRRGDFEVGVTGWSADYNDAQDFLFQFQTSTKQENFARFSNPDYDRLMDEASVTSDQGKRAQLLERAEKILLQELPVLPIFLRTSRNLVSTQVKGWDHNPLDVVYVKNLSLEK